MRALRVWRSRKVRACDDASAGGGESCEPSSEGISKSTFGSDGSFDCGCKILGALTSKLYNSDSGTRRSTNAGDDGAFGIGSDNLLTATRTTSKQTRPRRRARSGRNRARSALIVARAALRPAHTRRSSRVRRLEVEGVAGSLVDTDAREIGGGGRIRIVL